jgi:hypothetical protein
MDNLYFACISTGRPENIAKIKEITGIDFVYYTRPQDVVEYGVAGAKKVIGVAGNIVEARNQATKDALSQGKLCVQISDDIKGIYKAIIKDGKKSRVKIPFADAVTEMAEYCKAMNIKYAGTAVTDNPLNYNEKDIALNKLIVNDLIIVGEMFDEKADLKEDYELFCRIVSNGGFTARFEKFLVDFPHRENKGGANTYRTYDYEKQCNQYVIDKYPLLVREHSKRDNQLEIIYSNIKKVRAMNRK